MPNLQQFSTEVSNAAFLSPITGTLATDFVKAAYEIYTRDVEAACVLGAGGMRVRVLEYLEGQQAIWWPSEITPREAIEDLISDIKELEV